MKTYLDLAPKYLSGHKNKTRLTVLSVVMAVALVVGIFSMLDALVTFEKAQVLKSEGNYHILIRNPTQTEIDIIASRIDVENSGMLKDLGEGKINDEMCAMGYMDGNFAGNLNIVLAEGEAPKNDNEIMLEKWYLDQLALHIGDTVNIALSNGIADDYVISGVINDWGATKAASIPFVFVSKGTSEGLSAVTSQYFVLFKVGVNIQNTEREIAAGLNISADRVGYNEGLLALMLQTKNNRVLTFYLIGMVLFGLVLVTGIVMIYNTFNISVMDRVRQFGLLRCIGASKKQIRRIVRRESLIISLKAIPIGVLGGMFITFICSGILKIYNPYLFGDISIFSFSGIGIGAGVLTGLLTVLIASMLPAKKAAKVSPVNAVTGSESVKISGRQKQGVLTRLFPVEIAMGVNNAINKKRTLILMTSSIAISIILLLGFSVLVNPAFMGMKTDEPYTPDLTLTSDQGITSELSEKLSQIEGGEVLGKPTEHQIDLQLSGKNDEQTVNEVAAVIDETITLHDKRQLNAEADNAFMTIAVFIYGFVAVIALISILNMINTMNTSIVSRSKYLAMLRAVGMSDKQLNKMVLAQSITYSLTGCITGCVLGVVLQKELLDFLATDWSFPLYQIVGITVICIMTGTLSVISPLKKIKETVISETITSL
ncbi:FtsX-like permease family protein [Acetobacterium paludosum]|uniref:FtsX-like permease family protein n=1 Tax=Acetobacterium paludosum TaxID=52693 RepID=A0A923HRW1_9FIRM|nr:ABC transporter permease [Acetobacterium paludosum]MBC3887528.1 FtsX-like permease family protein [Acetobacterium paludosum]